MNEDRGNEASSKGGFTLVELLVSVVVLSVGLLALTGASAVIAGQISGGAQMSTAAAIAQARFEWMRSLDCMTLAGGALATGGVSERWSATHMAGAVSVTDSVSFATRSGRRTFAYVSLIPCGGSE